MGVANSKNTASSIAKVANNIENSTTVDATQVANLSNLTYLQNCTFKAGNNISISNMIDVQAKSSQVATALQQADVSNDLSQQMDQEAASTVGFGSLGYANANNYSSQFASASTDVQNNMSATATQSSDQQNDTICINSTFIGKNISLLNGNSSNFISDQNLSITCPKWPL